MKTIVKYCMIYTVVAVLLLIMLARMMPISETEATGGVETTTKPVTETAQEIEVNGVTFYYELNPGDEVTILRTGECPPHLIIPEKIAGKNVYRIGAYAFYDQASLESVLIPEGVKELGEYAFAMCPSLKKVHIPTSIERFGHELFRGSNVQTIELADKQHPPLLNW